MSTGASREIRDGRPITYSSATISPSTTTRRRANPRTNDESDVGLSLREAAIEDMNRPIGELDDANPDRAGCCDKGERSGARCRNGRLVERPAGAGQSHRVELRDGGRRNIRPPVARHFRTVHRFPLRLKRRSYRVRVVERRDERYVGRKRLRLTRTLARAAGSDQNIPAVIVDYVTVTASTEQPHRVVVLTRHGGSGHRCGPQAA